MDPEKSFKPIGNVPKRISADGDLEFSENSSLPHFKSLCLRKDQFIFHALTRDLPPKESDDIWHIEIDTIAKDLVVPRKSVSRMPNCEEEAQESSGDSDLPHPKRLCSQRYQFTPHVSSKIFPTKKQKDFRDIQTDIRDGEVETSEHGAARKKLKLRPEVPKTGTADTDLDFSTFLTCPHFKCLFFKKGNFIFHASSGDNPPKYV